MDMNQERAMRLLVAILQITGPFEVSRDILEAPDSFSGKVVYVEPSLTGDEDTLRFSVKDHSEIQGELGSAER